MSMKQRTGGVLAGLGLTALVIVGVWVAPSVEHSQTTAVAARTLERGVIGAGASEPVAAPEPVVLAQRAPRPSGAEGGARPTAPAKEPLLRADQGEREGSTRLVEFGAEQDDKDFVVDVTVGDAALTVICVDKTVPDTDIAGDPQNIEARRWTLYAENGTDLLEEDFLFYRPDTGATSVVNPWSILDPDNPAYEHYG